MALMPRREILPCDGSRMPASIRIRVLLPAPSGPMRPKISPPSMERSIPWITSPSSKRLRSPWIWMRAMLLLQAQVDVGRHPGLEYSFFVGEIDFGLVDELDALLERLHVFGGKLRLAGDVAQGSGKLSLGIGIDNHRCLLSDAHLADIRLTDIDA